MVFIAEENHSVA